MGSFSSTFATSAGGTPQQRLIMSSGTFVTPRAGKYRITLVGVGSGAANNTQAGSSGALAQSLVTLAAGVTITVTLGSKGVGGVTPTTGGTSTVAATGLTTLTCTAGTPSSPGAASGGNVFNRNGVAGAVGSSKGGSSVAVYGTGYAATDQGGAGTGEAAPAYATWYGYVGGAALPGLTNVSTFFGSRILMPAGIGGQYSGTSLDPSIHGRPGGGGGYDVNGRGGRGGLFAGGGGSTSTSAGGDGGDLGGGGGSTAGSDYKGGDGGRAGCTIEWVED